MQKKFHFFLALCLLCLLLAACGSAQKNKKELSSSDPVTINAFISGGMTDDEFIRLFVEPVSRKLPHITMVRVKGSLVEMVAIGDTPDLLTYNPFDWFYVPEEMGLLYDVRPLMKENKFNMGIFKDEIAKGIESLGKNGEIYAIPHRINSYAFYYNLNIFDKFGVTPPTNGMTWDQVIELAKKLTRKEGDERYFGLDINMIRNLGSPYSLQLYDQVTNKAVISEKWRGIFELAQTIYNINGLNKPEYMDWSQNAIANPESRLAMTPGYTETLFSLMESEKATGMKWGVVSYPGFADLPGVNKQLVAESIFITAQSKHIATAFEVVKVLTSDEVQLENSRNATVSPLKGDKHVAQFAANIPELKDRDLSGILNTVYAMPSMPINKFNMVVMNSLDDAFQEVLKGGLDINSALRKAEEVANQQIAEQSQK